MDYLNEHKAARIIAIAGGCMALAVLLVGAWHMWAIIDRALAALH